MSVCYCWSGRARWLARDDDRFCSLCGTERARITPVGPVNQLPSGTVLLLYLSSAEANSKLTGRLAFFLAKQPERPPRVRWKSSDVTTVRLIDSHHAAPGALLLSFEADARVVTGAEYLGRSRLQVALDGEVYAFEVDQYSVTRGSGSAWLSLDDGNGSPGSTLLINRGAARGWTYLKFRSGRQTPVAWEAVHCDHPAVTVKLPEEPVAGTVATAVVEWDTARLKQVGEDQATFRLVPRGLPEHVHTQPVSWRPLRLVSFEPSLLRIPYLFSCRRDVRTIQLACAVQQKLYLLEVSSDAVWATARIAGGVPRWVSPGESVQVELGLLTDTIGQSIPPYHATVTFRFDNCGTQDFQVVVDDVRQTPSLDVPLIIDPGPPRIVLAHATGDLLVYLNGVGESGVEPSRLGVPLDAYNAAVSGGKNSAEVCERLIASARALDYRLGSPLGRPIVVCRQPWLSGKALSGVAAYDWTELCRHATSENETFGMVVRLDAWAARFVSLQSDERSLPQSVRTTDLLDTAGSAAIRCLIEQLLGDPTGMRRWFDSHDRTSATARFPSAAKWLIHATNALLSDFRWGPVYAWETFLESLHERLPQTRPMAFNIAWADKRFGELLREYCSRILRLAFQRLLSRQDSRCLLISPLFLREDISTAVQCEGRALGMTVRTKVPEWIEWTARKIITSPPLSPQTAELDIQRR